MATFWHKKKRRKIHILQKAFSRCYAQQSLGKLHLPNHQAIFEVGFLDIIFHQTSQLGHEVVGWVITSFAQIITVSNWLCHHFISTFTYIVNFQRAPLFVVVLCPYIYIYIYVPIFLQEFRNIPRNKGTWLSNCHSARFVHWHLPASHGNPPWPGLKSIPTGVS